MSWQFTIIDYTTNTNGVSTPITEPVGWDGINLHLKRDENWHGFFNYVDDSFGGLQFDGAGATILRNAYYNIGIDADVRLSIAYSCGDDDENNLNLYVGSFYFSSFKDYLADRCYVECSLEASKDFMDFKNRVDQEVDLDSLASFGQLPVAQTVTTSCTFEAGTNTIEVNQLMNGLLPGSQITVGNSGNNDGTYTVASAKPDYSNVVANVTSNTQALISLALSVNFNPANSTISVNQLLTVAPGQTLSFTQTGNDPNLITYTVVTAVQYFDYTLFTVTPAPAAIESLDSCAFQTFGVVANAPTSTIITVGENLNNGGPVNATITASWLENNLTPYNGLNEVITIPSKAITATSYYEMMVTKTFDLQMYRALNGALHIQVNSHLTPDFSILQSDIDETGQGLGVATQNALNTNNPPDTLIYFSPTALACNGSISYQLQVSGKLYNNGHPGNVVGHTYYLNNGGSNPQGFELWVVADSTFQGYSPTSPQVLYYQCFTNGSNTGTGHMGATINFNVNIPSTTSASFEPGTYLWVYFTFSIETYRDGCYPLLDLDASSFLSVSVNTTCDDTPCSVYFINEALSRCTESYSDGALRVYSDYFGRTNAQPYTSPTDGCAGFQAITNGLRIRGCLMPDGSIAPKFTASMKNLFEALDAIHNIGMCLEADTNRTGYQRIRVEPFDWFFPNNIIQQLNNTPMQFDNVMKYSREVQPSLIPSGLKCGYQQFETWNNNGLYDIFGERKYRTQITELTNMVDKTTKWMASDYAIEFTRREYGNSSADSRYDASTFILCLKKGWQSEVQFTGKQCLLVYDPEGILNQTNSAGTVGRTVHITNTGQTQNNCYFWINRYCDVDGAPGVKLCSGDYATGSPVTTGYFTPGFAPNVQIYDANNHSMSYTYDNVGYNFNSVPVIFIGGNGALLLNNLPLFGVSGNDTLTINCSPTINSFPGGPITTSNPSVMTVDESISPQLASPEGFVPQVSFPQVIFTTAQVPFMVSPHPVLATDYNCSLNDSNIPFYTVEQGINYSANIINPETVMNYRISPAHNAMRHYQNLVAYRGYQSSQLLFTTGTGNFYALGSVGDSCSPEGSNSVSEGGNLNPPIFATPAEAYPLFYPEIIKFEYPLSWAQFVAIQANPYGLVEFFHATEGTQQGWIFELQYKPYTGMAEFTLYPKIPN